MTPTTTHPLFAPRRTLLVAASAAAGLALLAPLASGQGNPNKPPPKQPAAISLDAKPNPIVFSTTTALSGRLTNVAQAGGVKIRFEQDATRPYGDDYKPSALTATTANNGRWSVSAKPATNTQYRAIAQASPPVTSPARLVLVRTLVGLRVSDSTPRRGSLVRFSGSVFPAHDGSRALIQRRTSSGGWATLARPALLDAGTLKSTYTKQLRVRSDGVYRVKVAGDGDHVNGFSRTRTLVVH
ncbi:MAG: hypothetical protein QOJ35_4208 [Solirubrobacteraceae bacterium]|jgi:hypothetical protein|nr:hypothetical protein [Solirubrobacteraceae bacterium]